jgi:hypothetical protein
MIPLILVIIFVPLISRYQPVNARWGVELDLLFFWKDKILWLLSFCCLFLIKKSNPWIIAFWGFLFWATIFSLDLGQSVWGMPNYSEGSITFLCYGILFLSACGMDEDLFEIVCRLSVSLVSVFAVIQIIYGNYLMFPPIKYLSGLSKLQTTAITFPLYMSFANPNHLGLYCALLFPIFIRAKKYHPSIPLLLLAIGSGSRGAWVAMLLTLPRKLWKWVPVVGGLSIICFYNAIIPKLVFSTSGRTFMWKHGVKLLHLLGRGPATFMVDFPQNLITQSETGWAPGVWVDRPHNMIIQIAHATGVLSLIPLIIIFWGAVKRPSIYRYGVYGFLIAGLFTDSVVSVTPIFAILVGLLYFKDREATLKSHSEYLIWKRNRSV